MLHLQGAALQMIEDAARRARDDLRALLELADLLLHGSAAVDGGGADAAVLAEALEFPRALERELARGGEDEGLHHRLVRHPAIDQGQRERRRLAGAGARLDDEVLALERGLPRSELHGGGIDPADLVDGAPDLGGQRQRVEGGQGEREGRLGKRFGRSCLVHLKRSIQFARSSASRARTTSRARGESPRIQRRSSSRAYRRRRSRG